MAAGKLQIEGSAVTDEAGEIVSASASIITSTAGITIGQVFANVLANPLVPQIGDALDASIPDVKCVRRTPTIVGLEGGFWHCKVICEYTLQRPTLQALPVRGGSSLTQIRTQVDGSGNPILVTYKDKTVQVTVDVPDHRGQFAIEITESTNDPWDIANDWVNHINEQAWRGGFAREWLCTNVQYQLLNVNVNPRLWTFNYEFEYNPHGYVYTAVYEDQDGNRPADLVDGTGIIDVLWHPERDFSTKFP